MMEFLRDKKVILASSSPRRKQLLEMMGVKFEQLFIMADEQFPSKLKPKKASEWVVHSKFKALPEIQPNHIYIVADTMVTIDGQILGKPQSAEEAVFMLRLLMGNWHKVITTLGVCTRNSTIVKTDQAKVFIDFLSQDELEDYIQTNLWVGKAGAYGIQDEFGLKKVLSIKGNFFTVMGLPTHLLYKSFQILASSTP